MCTTGRDGELGIFDPQFRRLRSVVASTAVDVCVVGPECGVLELLLGCSIAPPHQQI